MKKRRGRLIVLEGPDSHGKTTQARMLSSSFDGVIDIDGKEVACAYVKVPVPGLTSKAIYWALGNGMAKAHPQLFQALQFINKLAFQRRTLERLLRENDYVVLDRWSLSGYVYGKATGVSSALNDAMYRVLRAPDVVIVISGKSFKRPKADDSYESDAELQAAVKAEYERIGKTWPKHFLVRNDGTKEEVHHKIGSILRFEGITTWLQGPDGRASR